MFVQINGRYTKVARVVNIVGNWFFTAINHDEFQQKILSRKSLIYNLIIFYLLLYWIIQNNLHVSLYTLDERVFWNITWNLRMRFFQSNKFFPLNRNIMFFRLFKKVQNDVIASVSNVHLYLNIKLGFKHWFFYNLVILIK